MLCSDSIGSFLAGVVQGIVTGIRGLCNGIGPALYGLIFYLFHVDLSGKSGAGQHHKNATILENFDSDIVSHFYFLFFIFLYFLKAASHSCRHLSYAVLSINKTSRLWTLLYASQRRHHRGSLSFNGNI